MVCKDINSSPTVSEPIESHKVIGGKPPGSLLIPGNVVYIRKLKKLLSPGPNLVSADTGPLGKISEEVVPNMAETLQIYCLVVTKLATRISFISPCTSCLARQIDVYSSDHHGK